MKTKLLLLLVLLWGISLTTSSDLLSQPLWTQVNNGLTDTDVRTLAVSGTNIFAGTGNGGVFRSTDNGSSWVQVNNGLTNNQVQALLSVGNFIYAGTYGGVFRSSDLGSNWQPLNTGLTTLKVLALYHSGNYIYAGTAGGGIYRLPTNGTTWSQVNNGLTTVNINAFANNSQYIFAGGIGLFRSSNNGSSWDSIGPFDSIWVHTIAVLGDDIFVGTENYGVYRSTDNGDNWTQINNGLPNWIVQKLFVVGTGIFAGTNGGVYLSTNNGVNWSYTGLSAIAFSFATLGSDIYAGTGFTTGVYKRSISEMMSVVNVIITSDNAYVFGFGDVNGIINYYYPGVANILAAEIYSPNSGTETYTIAGSLSGKYIYIGAWSDEKTYQGTIAQFSDGNTTVLTSPTLPNPNIHWEVFATGIDLDPHSNDPEPYQPNYTPRANTNCPTLLNINNQIAIANSNAGSPTNTSVGWVSTTQIPGRVGVLAFGPPNIANSPFFPPQTVSGIDPNAQWMWYNPDPTNITNPFVTGSYPNFPDSLSREYLIFRVGPMDSLFTTDTCSCIDPPSGMVGWWTMDETSGPSNDIAGFNNSGTWINGPTPTNGKVDGALSFHNNYLEVQNHQELDFGRTDFSIDAWINTGNCKEGTISPIVDKFDVNSNIGYVFYLTQNPVGTLFLNLNINGITYISSTPVQINSSNPWLHIAVTVSRVSSPHIGYFYVNGQQVGTFTPANNGPVTNTVNLWIGNSRISQNNCIIWIDELELFNRALNASEIHDIWAADSCGKCKPSQPEFGQLCIFKFNDLNGDGKYNPIEGEVLLENWQFIIKDSTGNVVDSVFTTDDADIPSCVKVPAPGTYTITEVLQAGWTPTTPNLQTVTVQPGQTINLYFGNKQGCSCITPPSGMVGWWTGDGNANDISGYGNNGTLMGGANYGIGKVLQGFGIMSANDYVEVPHSSSINIMSDLSIDAWIITKDSLNTLTIVDKRGGTGGNPIGFSFFIYQGKLGFQLGDGQTALNHNAPSPIVADGNWHHVAVTVKRKYPNGGKLYVDGNLVLTFDPTTRPGNITNTSNLWIGQRMLSTPYGFNGYIDEVELFNRALDSTEIHDIWAADSCGKCKEPVNVEESKQMPEKFELLKNYPNPFSSNTTISFKVPTTSMVTLKVYDAMGIPVKILVNEVLVPGTYERTFDAQGLASGVYYYSLSAGNFIDTKMLIYIK